MLFFVVSFSIGSWFSRSDCRRYHSLLRRFERRKKTPWNECNAGNFKIDCAARRTSYGIIRGIYATISNSIFTSDLKKSCLECTISCYYNTRAIWVRSVCCIEWCCDSSNCDSSNIITHSSRDLLISCMKGVLLYQFPYSNCSAVMNSHSKANIITVFQSAMNSNAH